MRVMKTLVPIALLAFGFVAVAPASPPEAPTETRMENLFRQALDASFTPDREIIVSYVEFPPNGSVERHWHPGEEFIYVLEGEFELLIDGQEPIVGRPGRSVTHVPYRKVHAAKAGGKGAKIIVFRVHQQGAPERVPADGGSAGN